MPREPITLTPEQVREVETLAVLPSQDQIADYLGISRTTFKAIRARDEEVAVRHEKGRAKAIAHVANGLLQKARTGNATSSIFCLETQAGWREAPPNAPAEAGTQDPPRELLDHVAQKGARIGLPPRGGGSIPGGPAREPTAPPDAHVAMIPTGGQTD